LEGAGARPLKAFPTRGMGDARKPVAERAKCNGHEDRDSGEDVPSRLPSPGPSDSLQKAANCMLKQRECVRVNNFEGELQCADRGYDRPTLASKVNVASEIGARHDRTRQ